MYRRPYVAKLEEACVSAIDENNDGNSALWGSALMNNFYFDEPVPAIFCSSPEALSETFVRRHISLLNSGKNIVLGERALTGELPNSIANAVYVDFLTEKSLVRGACRRIYHGRPGKFAQSAWRLLIGRNYPAEKISFNLFEFGYLLVRHWDYALFSGKPFFVYFRGQDASKLLRDEDYVKKLKMIMPHAAGSIFVAPALKRNLERLDIPVGRYLIQPSGVDTRQFSPGEKDPNLIVSVGRFIEKKAHEDSIQAFSIVVRKRPGLKLRIIGGGERLEACRQLVEKLSLEGIVDLTGPADHETIKKSLNSASFYLQSSRIASDGDSEGFPSAIQEALASGTAVITTSHAGAADFLTHRKTAMLCSEGDIPGMSDNLLEVLYDRTLWLELVANGRSFAEKNLDGLAAVRNLESFIASALNARNAASSRFGAFPH